MPNALPRSPAAKMARKVASTCGAMAAAAAPWTTRAAISSVPDAESPAHRLASPKKATPTRKMRLRPSRSPRLPATMSPAANASM
jgi:hypothetical protein